MEAGTIEEIDIDRMASLLHLNIESTFRLTYAMLKRFKRQGFGHVINISSVLGTKVRPTAAVPMRRRNMPLRHSPKRYVWN